MHRSMTTNKIFKETTTDEQIGLILDIKSNENRFVTKLMNAARFKNFIHNKKK